MNRMFTFSEIANQIRNAPQKHRQRLVVIDGGGGAGKTTFASHLQKEIPGSFIVKIDDFYRPPQLRKPLESTRIINPNMDWDRFRILVLEAVRDNKEVSYQLYDFKQGTLTGDIIHAPKDAAIIVEGVWSMQEAFINFYDYKIWLEAPSVVRLERGILRDGEEMRKEWEEEWIPIDEYYKDTYKPESKADCIIDSVNSDFENNKIICV